VSALVTPNVGIVTLRDPRPEAAIDTAPVSIQDSAFEDAACALLVVGGNGRILRGNRAAARLAGRTLDALDGELVDVAYPTTAGGRALGELVGEAVAGTEPVGRELTVLATSGELHLVQWTAAPTAGGAVVAGVDVTSAHEVTAELAHQALHDPLTGLPNRVLLREHLDHALRRLDRHGGELAVLFVDLDRFKDVNDTLGHEAGDRLLVALAERLRRALRPSDTVARLAGDEFVVVCEDVDDGPAVTEIADRLLAAVERPFRIDGVDARVSASIGVSSVRESGADADRLLREADAAMYSVKERRGRGRRPAPVAGRTPRLTFEELREAFREGDLAVAFQPQVALTDGRLDAVEALVRWRHPKLGPLPPATVLASAEAGGRALDLGQAVLGAALEQAAVWRATAAAAGRSAPPVTVNLSLAEVADRDLVATVAAALDAAAVDADALRVEVPEAALVAEPAPVLRALRALRDLGVGTTLDDVGRGLAAVEAMGELPIGELKIDRPWVWAASRPWAPGHGVLRSVTKLARRLGVRAVAEGVEAEDELAAAVEAGCDAATGHWFAAAQDAELMAQLVRADLRWSTR